MAGGNGPGAGVSPPVLTVNCRLLIRACCALASVTSRENVYVPAVVVVPERVAETGPVPGMIERPGGRVPSYTVQVNGGVP